MIGMFSLATENAVLMPIAAKDEKKRKWADVLGVQVQEQTIYNSQMLGLFLAGNSNGIAAPHLAWDAKFKRLDDNLTALGNLILANDKGAIISRLFGHRAEAEIRDILGVPVVRSTVAGLDVVGSCGLANNKGALLHPEASEEELLIIKDVLKVRTDIGTLNTGNPFVGVCGIANSNGAVLGYTSSPVEVTRFDDTLS